MGRSHSCDEVDLAPGPTGILGPEIPSFPFRSLVMFGQENRNKGYSLGLFGAVGCKRRRLLAGKTTTAWRLGGEAMALEIKNDKRKTTN